MTTLVVPRFRPPRGVAVVRLGTVAEFPTRARDLYAALGFRVLRELRRYRKPGVVRDAPAV